MSNDKQERMLRHVQFMALANIVTMLLAREIALSKDAQGMADEWLNLIERTSDEMTFPYVDPAWSDLAAQEFRDSSIRLVLRARALATGERFDPDAYQRSWRKTDDDG